MAFIPKHSRGGQGYSGKGAVKAVDGEEKRVRGRGAGVWADAGGEEVKKIA